jgi:hypothetical protein
MRLVTPSFHEGESPFMSQPVFKHIPANNHRRVCQHFCHGDLVLNLMLTDMRVNFFIFVDWKQK